MPWGVAAAAVSAGAGLIGSSMQAGAISDASDAANARADQARADLEPWRTTGANALGVAGDLSGANGTDAATKAMANFHTDPGYQFQFDQGMRAIDAGAAAKGMARSGATLKAEQSFGTGLADQSFTNYYNRLYGLASLGENAAAGQGNASLQAGKTDMSAGNAQSSIYGNTASGLGSTANSLFSNGDFQGFIKGLGSSGGSSGGGGSVFVGNSGLGGLY